MSGNGERGYALFSLSPLYTWAKHALVVLLVLAVSIGSYVWYNRIGTDISPDSVVGLIYAVVGTTCIVLALILYSIRRRSRKRRAIGQLHAILNWHVALGIMGLALLTLHSFGNFNPRSGTYALYGMIALVISGFVGRVLDRVVPRLIAREASKALTEQGEDRIEAISRSLQSIAVHNTQEVHTFNANSGQTAAGPRALVPLQGAPHKGLPFQHKEPGGQEALASWDLAYISLEELPQELERDAPRYRFVPDKKSALGSRTALIPGAQKHMTALQDVQNALQREQFYRYIIRYWRAFHVFLALLTVGLTLWHLEYAAQLWLPVLLHH